MGADVFADERRAELVSIHRVKTLKIDVLVQSPDMQRNVEKPLDQIWVFLSIVAATCKNKVAPSALIS